MAESLVFLFALVITNCIWYLHAKDLRKQHADDLRSVHRQLTEIIDRNIFLSQARAYPASLPQREEPEVTEVVDPDWKEL